MPEPPEVLKDIAKEMAQQAEKCWMRPGYHFLPRDGWMNDPNGTVYFDGYFHMFYQKNPWQEIWGYMHWGHARSPDLVHWERLPIAFGPSYDDGEDHCYSGCAVDNAGILTAIYTSISENRPPEQWMATSQDGIHFKKFASNPIMNMSLHGEDEARTENWRDPYIWRETGENAWHCVIGGQLISQGPEGKKNPIPTAFHYLSDDLVRWKYIGPLIQGAHERPPENHPDPEWHIPNFECPNFFPLAPSDRENRTYCFVCAPHNKILYNIGQYRISSGEYSFLPTRWRVLDVGHAFYATNTWVHEDRAIIIGWVRVSGTGGWNGAQSIPRELSIRPDGHLRQQPIKELEKLRQDQIKIKDFTIDAINEIGYSFVNLSSLLDGENSAKMINILANSERQVEIKMLLSDFPRAFELRLYPEGADVKDKIAGLFGIDQDEGILYLGREHGTFSLLEDEKEIFLHIFLDNSIIEIFINERIAFTSTIRPKPDATPQLAFQFDDEAIKVKSLEIWKLGSIW